MEAHKSDSGAEVQSFRDRHSFIIFITGSIVVSALLVTIGMAMYNGSGAAQLDLSRPGYVSVRGQAANGESDFQSYSTVGNLDKEAMNNFIVLYDKQTQKIKAVDAFGGSPSPLSFVSLGIDEPAVSP